MESDHDQGDDEGAASQANVRSYECNFCKRGFSNAQALGGHMNIHRKDKAKLRQQSSNQTQPSKNLEVKSDTEESNKPNWNLHVSQQEHVPSRDEIHHMKQLPLFAESPVISSKCKTQKPQPPQGQIRGEITKEEALLLSAQGSSSSSELDLELRLGPEPQDSSAATGTRKFF